MKNGSQEIEGKWVFNISSDLNNICSWLEFDAEKEKGIYSEGRKRNLWNIT